MSMRDYTRMTVCVHLAADEHAECHDLGKSDVLNIGERVSIWCESPEQAEAISAAALDLAHRMRHRPMQVAKPESSVDEYARSQATGTLAH